MSVETGLRIEVEAAQLPMKRNRSQAESRINFVATAGDDSDRDAVTSNVSVDPTISLEAAAVYGRSTEETPSLSIRFISANSESIVNLTKDWRSSFQIAKRLFNID